MDPRTRRLAENEALFRNVNEEIGGAALAFGRDRASRYSFMCECSDADCHRLLELTLAEYEAVRARSDRFAVVPGHALPEIESVVETHAGYEVVEKLPEARELVTELDRRRA